MLELLRLDVFLLSLALPVATSSQAVTSTGTTPSPPNGAGTTAHTNATEYPVSGVSTSGSATCQSRTANYITHTLPQQCLRTDRAAAGSTSHADEAVTSSPVEFEKLSALSLSNVNASTFDSISSSSTSSPSSATLTTSVGGPLSTREVPTTSSTVPTSTQTPDAEVDSPLDTANFLSFEEWKKQNLAKVGQSPENLAQGRASGGERQRPGINNALDTLGEDSEIDLDFSGFGTGPMRESRPPPRPEGSSSDPSSSPPDDHDAAALSSTLRSKDAGRTCKERTNYASFDCAATVLKSNPECKSASSVLVENKDSYMLNICSASNKFFIIELCNDILIDTIVLANYEFFSSIFRHFRVSVSDRYPVKIDKWKDLGTFEARSTREVQAFLVENPLIWARYLRIEFLSHYGNEYYCPVSLLRVHGTTMMEEFRHQDEVARGVTDDDPTIEAEAAASSVAQEPQTSTEELLQPTVQSIPEVESKVESIITADTSKIPDAFYSKALEQTTADSSTSQFEDSSVSHQLFSDGGYLEPSQMTCAVKPDRTAYPSMSDQNRDQRSTMGPTSGSPPRTDGVISSTGTPIPSSSTAKSGAPPLADSSTSIQVEQTSQIRTAVQSSITPERTADRSNGNTLSPPLPKQPDEPSAKQSEPSKTNSTKPASSPPPNPQPSTQESFYKSIHKRLQQLESNSTLSLQYIEDQSRILRDAFGKVEKRQITATSNFLTQINSTVMAELQGFRTAYDQIWQSTVIELEGQREQYQREMLALSSRLTLMADELLWQKRLGIVQSTLLLLCLALVLFARAGDGSLEVPLVQQMVHRSQAALRSGVGHGFESPPYSPTRSSSTSPVSLFRRKTWRLSNGGSKSDGGNVTDGTGSRPESKDGSGRVPGPEMNFEPPTPSSKEEASDDEEVDEADEQEVQEGVVKAKETQSGPATPSGTRDSTKRALSWPDTGTEAVEKASSPLKHE